jgi:hypothetical protein
VLRPHELGESRQGGILARRSAGEDRQRRQCHEHAARPLAPQVRSISGKERHASEIGIGPAAESHFFVTAPEIATVDGPRSEWRRLRALGKQGGFLWTRRGED